MGARIGDFAQVLRPGVSEMAGFRDDDIHIAEVLNIVT
jgi:hypothetical protein